MSNIKNNVISFDMDGTIDDHFGDQEKNPHKHEIRGFIKQLINRGYEVYIITRRYGPENSSKGIGMEHVKVLKVAEELGIPSERIIFTNREWKYSFVQSIGSCMHVDDDEREQYWLERHSPEVTTILVGSEHWQEKLVSKIDGHDFLRIWLGNEDNILKLGIGLVITILLFMLLA